GLHKAARTATAESRVRYPPVRTRYHTMPPRRGPSVIGVTNGVMPPVVSRSASARARSRRAYAASCTVQARESARGWGGAARRGGEAGAGAARTGGLGT